MPHFEITVDGVVLFRAGSLAALLRVLEREADQWAKLFPDGTPRFVHTGDQLQPRYLAIAQHLKTSSEEKVEVAGQTQFEVFPPYESPEGRAIRSAALANRSKELSGVIQYWKIECRWASASLLDHRDEAGRLVRAGQATLLGARAAAAQFASVREMSQAAEAAIRLQAQIAETEAEADTFRRAMGIMADDRKTDIDQASARERRRHRARRKYERKMISVWKDRFEATHDAYVAKLQFEAPVDLWTKAARKHSDAARTALQTFLALAAAFGGGGVLLALLFGDHLARAYLVENCDSGSSVCKAAFSAKGPLVTGAILLAASFAIWVLRTIHRMYVSERHLAGSADEKRAFAETYLALIKDQNVSRDQEAIVLAALFRPGGDGLPGEENSVIDISSAAILAKVVSGSPGR